MPRLSLSCGYSSYSWGLITPRGDVRGLCLVLLLLSTESTGWEDPALLPKVKHVRLQACLMICFFLQTTNYKGAPAFYTFCLSQVANSAVWICISWFDGFGSVPSQIDRWKLLAASRSFQLLTISGLNPRRAIGSVGRFEIDWQRGNWVLLCLWLKGRYVLCTILKLPPSSNWARPRDQTARKKKWVPK